jgi:hypothetical protein
MQRILISEVKLANARPVRVGVSWENQTIPDGVRLALELLDPFNFLNEHTRRSDDQSDANYNSGLSYHPSLGSLLNLTAFEI